MTKYIDNMRNFLREDVGTVLLECTCFLIKLLNIITVVNFSRKLCARNKSSLSYESYLINRIQLMVNARNTNMLLITMAFSQNFHLFNYYAGSQSWSGQYTRALKYNYEYKITSPIPISKDK